MNHIIESIGRWGVVSTPLNLRLNRVKGGDIIEVPTELQRYPCTHQYSRIANVKDGIAHICEDMGSAHLMQNGDCDISGGPWWGMPVDLLEPAYTTRQADYWNWGNNSPGGGQGIHYTIARPVHRITVHPNDIKTRYAYIEADARKGEFSELPLGDEWIIHHKNADPSYGFRWIFRKTDHHCQPRNNTNHGVNNGENHKDQDQRHAYRTGIQCYVLR